MPSVDDRVTVSEHYWPANGGAVGTGRPDSARIAATKRKRRVSAMMRFVRAVGAVRVRLIDEC